LLTFAVLNDVKFGVIVKNAKSFSAQPQVNIDLHFKKQTYPKTHKYIFHLSLYTA